MLDKVICLRMLASNAFSPFSNLGVCFGKKQTITGRKNSK